MPGSAPPIANEHEGLRAFIAQQHAGIRNAAYGLSDEQAHSAPSASSISIAGLVKHVTVCERSWVERVSAAPGLPPSDSRPVEEQTADYGQDWDPTGQSITDLLTRFDEVAAETEEVVPGLDLAGAGAARGTMVPQGPRGVVGALGAAPPHRGDRPSRRTR